MIFVVLLWAVLETLFSGSLNLKEFIETLLYTLQRDFFGWIPALISAAIIMDYLFNAWDLRKYKAIVFSN